MRGPNLTLESWIKYRDESGNLVVRDHRVLETNSWVKQAAQLFIAFTRGTSFANVTNTNGGSSTIDGSEGTVMRVIGTSFSEGIIVGIGTDILNRDDIAISGANLDDEIGDGSSSGKLNYQKPGVLTGPLSVSGGYRISLARNFDNNSGNTITVNECAVYTLTNQFTSANFRMMIIRDLVVPSLAILNNELLTLKYHFDFLI